MYQSKTFPNMTFRIQVFYGIHIFENQMVFIGIATFFVGNTIFRGWALYRFYTTPIMYCIYCFFCREVRMRSFSLRGTDSKSHLAQGFSVVTLS